MIYFVGAWLTLQVKGWRTLFKGTVEFQKTDDSATIADVAVRKRHQQLDEILAFITSAIKEIRKVVHQKTLVRNAHIYKRLLYETCASIERAQAYMLCKLDCVKCRWRILHDKLFLKTALLIFG